MEDVKISELIRSRRRTVELIVTEDARLVVRAPLRTPRRFIDELVEKRHDWISRKMAEAGSRAAPPPTRFCDGERLLYLGRRYEMRIIDSPGTHVGLLDGTFHIPRQVVPYAARFMKSWYRREALRLINERCLYFSNIFGYAPRAVRISNAEKRWGSCGPGGTLNFSWKLAMAPPEVLNYLVVHEMAHMMHPNHSRLFWEAVESVLPDFASGREWLKDNGHLLAI